MYSLKFEKSSIVVGRAKELGDVLADGSLFLQRLLLLHAHHVCVPATEQHRVNQTKLQSSPPLSDLQCRESIVRVTNKHMLSLKQKYLFFLSTKYRATG